MKLSTKIILPIILISALLISLSGCIIPTVTPSPGAGDTTGGTITGTFETPEACCMSNRDHTEGWVPLVNANVSVIDLKGVAHTTKTDSDGKYWLTDVAPGIYYVVTACCECEDREGVYKDVVEEKLKEGDTYDAGIADCESTALGLMVDYLLSGDVFVEEDCNCYCNCFDEESQIYASLVTTGVKLRVAAINLLNPATKPLEKIRANADFQGFVVELCDLLEACCVEPGATPAPTGSPPTPPTKYTLTLLANPAEGAASFTGAGTHNPGDVVAVNTKANPGYEFTGWTETAGVPPSIVTGDLGSEPLSVTMNGNATLTAHFDCPPITGLEINIGEFVANEMGIEMSKNGEPDITLCLDECATISSVTVYYACVPPGSLEITDLTDDSLDWTWDAEKISFNLATGAVCLVGGLEGTPGKYTINVIYTDPCGDTVSDSVDVEFKDCSIQYTLTMAVSPEGGGTTTPAVGSHTYDEGTVVPIEAFAAACYDFVSWTGDVTGSANPTTVIMNGNKTVTANFELDPCCGNEPPSISIDDKCINAGYSLSYAPGDTCPDYTADDDGTSGPPSYALSNEPTGMIINSGTGEITWDTACEDAGTYPDIEVTITDACGETASDTFTLTVKGVCDLPDLLTIDSCWWTYCGTNSLKAEFSDGGGDIEIGKTYKGWCAHAELYGLPIHNDVMHVYCSLELGGYWNKINWIVNHRDGYDRDQVQDAIWHYIHGYIVSGGAAVLVSEADSYESNFGRFCPDIGDFYIALLTHNPIDDYGIYRCHDQNIMIEVERIDHCLE